MTKKLYEKREELRAIFGRDVVKRIFRSWVDFVFSEVDSPPVPGMTAAELQARPKTRKRRKHQSSPGGTRNLAGQHHGHTHDDTHGQHSPPVEILKKPASY